MSRSLAVTAAVLLALLAAPSHASGPRMPLTEGFVASTSIGEPTWIRQFGSAGFDQAFGTDADGSGVFVVGMVEGALAGQTSAGGVDAFVRKYDPDGNEVWTHQFGTTGNDVATGVAVGHGGIFVAGYVSGSLPGQTSVGESDAFVRMYDPDGSELWTRQYGTEATEWSGPIAADSTSIYVAGTTAGVFPGQANAGDYDAFVRRIDPAGNEVWTRQLGRPGTDRLDLEGLAVDATGVYITGETGGEGWDIFLQKLSLDGTAVWEKEITTSGDDRAPGIALGPSGLYLAGVTRGALPEQTSQGGADAFAQSYDRDGNLIWSEQFGTTAYDGALPVAADAFGAWVGGLTAGTLPGQSSAGQNDAFLRRYDPSGAVEWTKQFGTPGGEQLYGIAFAGDRLYVAGSTGGTFAGEANSGTDDAFVAMFVVGPATPPVPLLYSTYVGGSGWDRVNAIVSDSSGRAFVAGTTESSDFPTTGGAFSTVLSGTHDAFLFILSANGRTVAHSTLFGGSEIDVGEDVKLDPNGDVVVLGGTTSPDLPTTPGAFDGAYNGEGDVFVAKWSPTGDLLFATYLGGSRLDVAGAVAIDAAGDIYIFGTSGSMDFPTTLNAFGATLNGPEDAFLVKMRSDGTDLVYATYLGGIESDKGLGLALDLAGSAYVAGGTNSTDFPTTAGAFDTTWNGGYDGFVAKVNANGTAVEYSTFLGGSLGERLTAIAVDSSGNAFVVGAEVESPDFPTVAGSFDETFNGGFDASVTKLNPTGSNLEYSSFLGGTGGDHAASVSVDLTSTAYVVGGSGAAPGFPSTPNAYDPTDNGGGDAFVVRVNAAGTALLSSGFMGGASGESALSADVREPGHVFAAGVTSSADFPLSMDGFDTSLGGFTDGYIFRLDVSENSPPHASFLAAPSIGTLSTDFRFNASASSDLEDPPGSIRVRWDWENDGQWDTPYSVDKEIAHRYDASGAWSVSLEVADSGGLTGSSTRTVTVATPVALAIAAAPGSGQAPLTVHFAAIAAGGVEPYAYAWDFGDGETAFTETVKHTYAAAGEYVVSVVVVDGLGQDSNNTTTIIVRPGLGVGGVGVGTEILAPAAGAAILAAFGALWFVRYRRRRRSPPDS